MKKTQVSKKRNEILLLWRRAIERCSTCIPQETGLYHIDEKFVVEINGRNSIYIWRMHEFDEITIYKLRYEKDTKDIDVLVLSPYENADFSYVTDIDGAWWDFLVQDLPAFTRALLNYPQKAKKIQKQKDMERERLIRESFAKKFKNP